eukprot:6209618-Pleurochrysis_carterae.AAC.4
MVSVAVGQQPTVCRLKCLHHSIRVQRLSMSVRPFWHVHSTAVGVYDYAQQSRSALKTCACKTKCSSA